jgi:hypothetical protein
VDILATRKTIAGLRRLDYIALAYLVEQPAWQRLSHIERKANTTERTILAKKLTI